MSIPPIAKNVLSYLKQFDLTAVAVSRDRRLYATRDPSGAESAFWARASDVGALIRLARADSGDVVAAARALGVRLVSHTDVLQKTEELTKRLDIGLRSAQQSGAMKAFNSEYRARRLAARETGQGFMSYGAAKARLRKALIETAAGKAGLGIVARVFEDRPPDPQ
jgi:hypothetical protein